jgi:glycerophosphoryl diester phosphodiesterase
MAYRPLAGEAGFVHVCAHRGHSAGAPENTIPALTEAARLGATVSEIDIVLTADDELVLLHDEIIDRTTSGKGRAAAYALAELQELDAGSWFGPGFAGTHVPTLREALSIARALEMGLLVEIKERRRPEVLIDRLVALLEETKSIDDVLVISFDHPSLVELRRRDPRIRTEIITHARHVDIGGVAIAAGVASVAIEWDMFHESDARALHTLGIATRVTIPRPDRIAFRRDYGLDPLPTICNALSAGLIDVLAGDDTAAVADLVRSSTNAP